VVRTAACSGSNTAIGGTGSTVDIPDTITDYSAYRQTSSGSTGGSSVRPLAGSRLKCSYGDPPVTERKPQEMTFPTWIEKQISDAAERGAFDDLPGLGKPLPQQDGDVAETWALNWARREGLSTREMLPTPLKLRAESAQLAENVHVLKSEQDVRDAVAELNQRIMEWRRIPIGPPIFVRLVDEADLLSRWQAAQQARAEAPAGDAEARAPARRQFGWLRALLWGRRVRARDDLSGSAG